jgi:hypothetical protein
MCPSSGDINRLMMSTNIPFTLYPRRSSKGISDIPPRRPHFNKMQTADVAGGKPIAVCLQSISDVNDVIPLVGFYDIHGRKREELFYYSVKDTTRD